MLTDTASGSLVKYDVSYLTYSPGPKSVSNDLIWLLARNGTQFEILWCYMNGTGKKFDAWVYSYATNKLVEQSFKGSYTFEPWKSAPVPKLDTIDLTKTPTYTGHTFTFNGITSTGGTLRGIQLNSSDGSQIKLPDLTVAPLHSVDVGEQNGWSADSWHELHMLADRSTTPYYMIAYSNTPNGYAINLDTGKVSIAEFGTKVVFQGDTSDSDDDSSTSSDNPGIEMEASKPSFPLYSPLTLNFTASSSTYDSWNNTQLKVEFTDPNGRDLDVNGFWDGDKNWIVRITPMETGSWEWKSVSSDPSMDVKTGSFRCVSGPDTPPGFLDVDPAHPHHFAYSNGASFQPQMVCLSLTAFAPKTFTPVMKAVAAQGFNRTVSTWILPSTISKGSMLPYLNNNPNALNLPFFQLLDARIAACNAAGIIPDIGLCEPTSPYLTQLTTAQISSLWSYVVSRYSSYNVCWTLFGANLNGQLSAQEMSLYTSLATLTQQLDPEKHMIQAVLPGSSRVVLPPVTPDTSSSTTSAYVVSPASMDLWPSDMSSLEAQRKDREIYELRTPENLVDGVSSILLDGGDLNVIDADYTYKKPLVIMENRPSTDGAQTRAEMWETVMRGGYWVNCAPGSGDSSPLNLEVTKWEATCGSVLHMFQFDLLSMQSKLLSAVSTDAPLVPNTVWVMADPGSQYLVYFTKGGSVNLDMLEATGKLQAQWINPRTGQKLAPFSVQGARKVEFTTPDAHDWVLTVLRSDYVNQSS